MISHQPSSETSDQVGTKQPVDDAAEDLRLTLNSLDMGVLIVDGDMNMELINAACYRLWDVGEDKLKPGSKFRELLRLSRDLGFYDVPDEEWGSYVKSREQEIISGHIEPRTFDRADGKTMVYSVTSLSGEKRLVSYFDITDQKQKQDALEQAEAKALAADRAKSEFLANMSHEIRTPMNGVMGMAELLANTSLDPKQKMFTDVIVKSGASLLTIINDILDFSKIDAGQMELDPAPFRLSEAIEDVATLVSARVAEKEDLELIVRVDPNLPQWFVGDVGRIRQIITNLMGNGVKFTDRGHVYANVSGSIITDNHPPHAELEFRIEDTGIGIPEEDVAKVFDKFSQVDASATRKHEGTGLGLSIASSLVELMGGDIGVESVEGQGTTFWFKISLPVHNEQNVVRTAPIDVSGSRVLIVDDNEVNRSILLEQMNSWKFDCAAVSSANEALALLRSAYDQSVLIDCVVMDYHMPVTSGGEAVQQIRSDPKLSSTPVLMLTSVDQTEAGEKFSTLGVQGHLVKPTRSSLLLETIVQILQDAKGRNQQKR